MDIITDCEKMQSIGLKARQTGISLALVPTMGFFHEGHLSLMRWAGNNADKVVVSLFVNPAQFGPGEDLERYPRDQQRDMDLARSLGVDFFFIPEPDDIYPPGFDTWVESSGLSRKLCGKSRPGHFRGVATVVCKLLNIVMPAMAVFGRKDRQQLLIIRKMVRDLNMPVIIEGRPTFREPDGLAMSSRNAYLTPEERKLAPHIYKGMQMIRSEALSGETGCKELEARLVKYYRENMPGCEIDYVRIAESETLERPESPGPGTFLAAAVKLGRARLIDNIDLA
ncbi:MAG: pantoate--beta-alanine ligase [Desulfonatronovibrio sp.]